MTIDQLQAEVMLLPTHVRAELAQMLLASLDGEAEIEAAWEDEAERRYARFLAGESEAISAAQALAELRSEQDR